MPIQAVTIDFWNTLYDSSGGEGRDAERARVVLHHAERLGQPIQLAALKAAQKAAWEHFNRVWREEHRTPPTRTMVEFYWRELGVNADAEAIDGVTHIFSEGVLNHPPSLLTGVAEALEELTRVLGMKHIALISDTAFSPGRVLRQIMERDGIAQYFNVFSFSDETGVSKPNPLAYQTALVGAPCTLAASVHIGDIERTDIAGAKALGMKAILFAGDPKNQMNDEHAHAPTQADAKADTWQHVVEIIRDL
jgi:putative hydrolase of the HAD superfamily